MKTHGAAVYIDVVGHAFVFDYGATGGRASTMANLGWAWWSWLLRELQLRAL